MLELSFVKNSSRFALFPPMWK